MKRSLHIRIAGEYRPGDPPPDGYCNWHEWAEVQYKSGLRQLTCGNCGLWRFPQELSGKTVQFEGILMPGDKFVVSSPICKQCAAGLCEEA